MTTIKRNWTIIGILLIAALLLLPATQARAETVKYKITSYLTKVEGIPVPDVEGHVLLVYERRGVAIFENGETAVYHTRGTANVINGQGPFDGYSQFIYKDGSTFMTEYTGTLTMAPGEKLPSFKGKGKYIKGTGRFEGIKGKMSFTGKYITPYTEDKTKGDTVVDVTGTRTLPKK